MATRTLHVCQSCRVAYSHPIKNCFECPGTTKQEKIPHPSPKGYFDGKDAYKKYQGWLKDNNLKEGRC